MNQPSSDPPPALRHALDALAAGLDLAEGASSDAFAEIMAGRADDAAIAALLLGLREKGETAGEVAGAARALRGAMRVVHHPSPDALVDTCGTGGGTVRTLNLSTAAAFVVAGAGIPVAKHGNRSFTSRSGSADVLEALGIEIGHTPERAGEILADVGIVFLFAPTYHPAMRHVAAVRKQLGVTTIMNLVGPLANPAGAARQVVGVSDAGRGPVMADALLRLGATHAMVVHGEVGVDEVSPVGRTQVWEVSDGAVREWTIDAAALGGSASSLEGLGGGEPTENAAAIHAMLHAPRAAPRALEEAVLLNAAAAIRVSRDGVTMEDALEEARASLHGGAAAVRFDALRRAGAVSTSG